jgi:hypothetical protein
MSRVGVLKTLWQSVRTLPKSFRLGMVHTVIGLIAAIILAFVLIKMVLPAFPRLQDFSRDMGLAVAVRLERLISIPAGGIELRHNDRAAFAIVDLHPSDRPAEGTERVSKNAYRDACLNAFADRSAPAVCDPRQAIEREYLAAAITIVSRHARAVVVDVLLQDSDATGPGSGEAALRDAIWNSPAQVLFAAPVIDVAETSAPGLGLALLAAEGRPAFSQGAAVRPHQIPASHAASVRASVAIAGVPFPVAEQPVRRFQRCFRVTGEAGLVPSLPWAVAQWLRDGEGRDWDCRSDRVPRRIVYTIPGLDQSLADGVEPAIYQQVLTHCNARDLWITKTACGSGKALKDRVVILGASHPIRRDRHFTPLGDMSGPEVVVNAIRSFTVFDGFEDPGSWRVFFGKCGSILLITAVVWLPFYVFDARTREKMRQSGSGVLSLATLWRIVAFGLATGAACTGALWLSTGGSKVAPDVDILLPVMAVSLETLHEALQKIKEWIEPTLLRILRLEHEQ